MKLGDCEEGALFELERTPASQLVVVNVGVPNRQEGDVDLCEHPSIDPQIEKSKNVSVCGREGIGGGTDMTDTKSRMLANASAHNATHHSFIHTPHRADIDVR